MCVSAYPATTSAITHTMRFETEGCLGITQTGLGLQTLGLCRSFSCMLDDQDLDPYPERVALSPRRRGFLLLYTHIDVYCRSCADVCYRYTCHARYRMQNSFWAVTPRRDRRKPHRHDVITSMGVRWDDQQAKRSGNFRSFGPTSCIYPMLRGNRRRPCPFVSCWRTVSM